MEIDNRRIEDLVFLGADATIKQTYSLPIQGFRIPIYIGCISCRGLSDKVYHIEVMYTVAPQDDKAPVFRLFRTIQD